MKKVVLAIIGFMLSVSGVEAVENVYLLSNNSYGLEQAGDVLLEFGGEASLAEWNDIRSDYSGMAEELAGLTGLAGGESVYVTYYGQTGFGSSRFVLVNSEGAEPEGQSVYADIDDFTLSLCNSSEPCRVLVEYDKASAISYVRRLVCSGSLNSFRRAASIMEQVMSDPAASHSEEEYFLSALTRTMMLMVNDKGGDDGSIFELLRAFGVTIEGDSILPMNMKAMVELGSDGQYKFPEGAPDLETLLDVLSIDGADEVSGIIDELDMISDGFSTYFVSYETGLNHTVEIDHSDVLLFKGIMSLFKGLLTFESAYDLNCGSEENLATAIIANKVCYQDILDNYPTFLEILPTEVVPGEEPVDGLAILADARQGFIDGFQCGIDFINSVMNEADDQRDDLLFFSDSRVPPRIAARLEQFRDSLIYDQPIEFMAVEDKEYVIVKNGTTYATLTVEMAFNEQANKATLRLERDGVLYQYNSDHIEITEVDDYLVAIFNKAFCSDPEEDEYDNYDMYIEGRLSFDRSHMDNVILSDWEDLSIMNMEAELVDSEADTLVVDLNPLFGSGRYPMPVSIRDILPQFDRGTNYPLAGTMGYGFIERGIDPDAAAQLGGIFPQGSQAHWRSLGLVYGGEFYIDTVDPGQLVYDNYATKVVGSWQPQQVFYDAANQGYTELYDEDEMIESVSMAKGDDGYFYMSVELKPEYYNTGGRYLWIDMKFYNSHEVNSEDDMKLEVYFSNGSLNDSIHINTSVFTRNQDWDEWETRFAEGAKVNENSIDIAIEMGEDNLAGKYFQLEAHLIGGGWWEEYDVAEQCISDKVRIVGNDGVRELYDYTGTVAFDGYEEGPIIVQACSDIYHASDSIAASTTLDGPGEFILEDIPAGFSGIIRAIIPNRELEVTDVIGDDYSSYYSEVLTSDGVFSYAIVVPDTNQVKESAEVISRRVEVSADFDMSTAEGDTSTLWYSFTPTESGMYYFDDTYVEDNWSYEQEVFLKDTMESLEFEAQTYFLGGVCYFFYAEAGSEYLIKVSYTIEVESGWGGSDGHYMFKIGGPELAMNFTNDLRCNAEEIPLDVWAYGYMEDISGEDLTEVGCSDYDDIWYKFTAMETGVYSLERISNRWGVTMAVFEKGKHTAMMEARGCVEDMLFSCEAGEEYEIRIGGYSSSYNPEIQLLLTYTGFAEPENDEAGNAIAIGLGELVSGTTVGTLPDMGDPWDDTHDVWYEFTAETEGVYSVGFNGNGFSPEITVYDSLLDPVAEIGDYFDGSNNKFYGIAGAKYYLCVAISGGYQSDFDMVVNWGRAGVANDHWLNAERIYPYELVIGTTDGMTGVDITDDVCEDYIDSWYVFTPIASGYCNLQVSGVDGSSSPRYSLYVREWTNLFNSAGEMIGIHRPCDSFDGVMGFEAVVGNDYYVRVAQKDRQTTDYSIYLTGTPYGLHGDIDYNGYIDIADLELLSEHWLDNVAEDRSLNYLDVNYDGRVDLLDLGVMSEKWFSWME